MGSGCRAIRRYAPVVCTLLLSTGLAPGGASAHGRSRSFSSWQVSEGQARVRLRIPDIELTRLPHAADAGAAGVVRYVSSHLRLLADGVPCPATNAIILDAPAGWSVVEWSATCPSGAAVVMESLLLRELVPSHVHFTRVRLSDGSLVERVLSRREPRWEIGRPRDALWATQPASLASYVRLGVAHILSGWDHLAFVLALLVLAGTLGEVTTLVSAFTVAHSITLALAVLGVVRPEAGAVEALIGFSIALVAAENASILAAHDPVIATTVVAGLAGLAVLAVVGIGSLSPLTLFGLAMFSSCHFHLLRHVERPARLRAAVAFAFGLIHGFGFAGVLAELDIPTGRLAAALFGFNVGVEIGQLAAVVLIWPLLRWLARARAGRWHRLVAEAGSAGIGGLGLFWFVTRAFG